MPGTTFIQILKHQATTRPQGLAFRCGEQLWTFADIDRDTNRVANALAALGVGASDRVAALTKYHVDTLLLTLGAAKLGAVCMPVNWRLAPAEVQYIVEHGGAKLMMADRAFLPLVNLPALPTIKQVVVTDGAHDGLPAWRDWFGAAADQFQAVDAQPEDPMLQLYSSGTTGLPKGVVLSHAGLIFNCQLGEGVCGRSMSTRWWAMLCPPSTLPAPPWGCFRCMPGRWAPATPTSTPAPSSTPSASTASPTPSWCRP